MSLLQKHKIVKQKKNGFMFIASGIRFKNYVKKSKKEKIKVYYLQDGLFFKTIVLSLLRARKSVLVCQHADFLFKLDMNSPCSFGCKKSM